MLNLDADKLEAAAQAAFALTQNSRRWQTAIARAFANMRENPYQTLTADGALLLVSPASSELYEVTEGRCERIDGERRVACKAHAQGFPCWHRAARRLLARYNSKH